VEKMNRNDPVILVVEDNDDDVALIRRAFRKTSVTKRVEVARGGAEALAYLFGRPPYDDRTRYPLPDLVLLDLKMPRMDGFEVLEIIKSASRTRRIPVVVLTSSSESKDVGRSYDLGANSYLVKPVAFEHFSCVVAELEKYWLALNTTSAAEERVGVGG
jgi:CheY-like chemotaxis protein